MFWVLSVETWCASKFHFFAGARFSAFFISQMLPFRWDNPAALRVYNPHIWETFLGQGELLVYLSNSSLCRVVVLLHIDLCHVSGFLFTIDWIWVVAWQVLMLSCIDKSFSFPAFNRYRREGPFINKIVRFREHVDWFTVLMSNSKEVNQFFLLSSWWIIFKYLHEYNWR